MAAEYLDYQFEDSLSFIETFDEAPLWSASFGLFLLEQIELKANMTVVDVGCGAGFPLMELAGRLGNTCKLFGIDPWENAHIRAKKKIQQYGLSHVEVIQASAEQLPFEDNSIDLIVSNLGINNFDKPNEVFKECNRVLKPKGKLALTTNVNGHWRAFYLIFEATLAQLNRQDLVEKLVEHQAHRGSTESISQLFWDNHFSLSAIVSDSFQMRFLDGSAFLNHHFVKLGWLDAWRNLLPQTDVKEIFLLLEENLNRYAAEKGQLSLSVPMAYIEGEKIN